MDTRGFSKGRVSAVLLRTSAPEGSTQMSTKECIGYAPHAKQKLNVGNQYYQTPGTIVIQHRPRIIPIAPGLFEVVVKALGLTEYSVAVFVGQCELCSSLIDKRREEAKRLKVNLPLPPPNWRNRVCFEQRIKSPAQTALHGHEHWYV